MTSVSGQSVIKIGALVSGNQTFIYFKAVAPGNARLVYNPNPMTGTIINVTVQ